MDAQRKELLVQVSRDLLVGWLRTGRLEYTVVASEPVAGRPLGEVRHVRFWVGVGLDGAEFSLDEMVALFDLLDDEYQQVELAVGRSGRLPHEICTTIRYPPGDARAMAALDRLRFIE